MIAHIVSMVLCATVSTASLGIAADVAVNGVAFDSQTRQSLERAYGVPIKPGRYWYDKVSESGGLEGGPAAGQIDPNVMLGGPLGGIVNGRELHEKDVAAPREATATELRCKALWSIYLKESGRMTKDDRMWREHDLQQIEAMNRIRNNCTSTACRFLPGIRCLAPNSPS